MTFAFTVYTKKCPFLPFLHYFIFCAKMKLYCVVRPPVSSIGIFFCLLCLCVQSAVVHLLLVLKLLWLEWKSQEIMIISLHITIFISSLTHSLACAQCSSPFSMIILCVMFNVCAWFPSIHHHTIIPYTKNYNSRSYQIPFQNDHNDDNHDIMIHIY